MRRNRAKDHIPPTLPFDPEHIIDEWRRLYDWCVLSRKRVEMIEAISCLGQKFSATFNAYRLAKKPQRRAHFFNELLVSFEGIQTFYQRLPEAERIPLTWR
jgi:hypothetical protein